MELVKLQFLESDIDTYLDRCRSETSTPIGPITDHRNQVRRHRLVIDVAYLNVADMATIFFRANSVKKAELFFLSVMQMPERVLARDVFCFEIPRYERVSKPG